MVYGFPDSIVGLDTMTVTVSESAVNAILPKCENNPGLFLTYMEAQILEDFRIDVRTLSLVRMWTNMASLSGDGLLRLNHGGLAGQSIRDLIFVLEK